MTEDFIPRSLFHRALRGWWLLVAGMLLGGGLAFIFHLLRPPIYEGRASIAFAFDLARTGKITQYEEDIAMGMAGTIINQSPVPEQVIAAAQARNIPLEDYPQWRKVSLERRNYLWVLRVRFSNPQQAAEIANLWIELGYVQLLEAQKHTEQAESLRRSMESLESCLQNMAVVEPAAAQCAWHSQAEVQSELRTLNQRYLQEKQAARGLIPALSVAPIEKASPDADPISYDRNGMMLAGALLGLAAALILLVSGLDQRLGQVFHRQRRR